MQFQCDDIWRRVDQLDFRFGDELTSRPRRRDDQGDELTCSPNKYPPPPAPPPRSIILEWGGGGGGDLFTGGDFKPVITFFFVHAHVVGGGGRSLVFSLYIPSYAITEVSEEGGGGRSLQAVQPLLDHNEGGGGGNYIWRMILMSELEQCKIIL